MEDLLRFIVEHLVSRPEDVRVDARQSRGTTVLEVRVSSEDAGRVIGRSGMTINAIRTIMQLAGSRKRKRVWVELKDDDSEDSPADEDFVADEEETT